MNVSVALATHNGARFLLEQLDSIARQSLLPHELVISDDASTDDTVAIARAFARSAPFSVQVLQNDTALGAGGNFMRAALACRGELVAFSDQDDVWAEAKLARSTSWFADPEVQLVVHGWTLVDDELRERGRRIPKERVFERLQAPKWGQAPGMAMTFRRSLLDLCEWPRRPPSHERGRPLLHDEWVYGLARVAGRIVFVGEALCLYRQHTANVQGAPEQTLRRRAELFVQVGEEYYAQRALQADAWAVLLADVAPEEAASYRRLAGAARERARVHGDGRRFRALLRAARNGAYRPRTRDGFGVRGLVRDVALVAAGRT
jgi:glycosyltransferase involved in cell wall biosynthesis